MLFSWSHWRWYCYGSVVDGAVVMVLKSIPVVKAVVPTKMKHATRRTFVSLSKVHTPLVFFVLRYYLSFPCFVMTIRRNGEFVGSYWWCCCHIFSVCEPVSISINNILVASCEGAVWIVDFVNVA